MKVTHFDTESRVAYIQLTRRNLLALLAKLDQNRDARELAEVHERSVRRSELSKCTIVSPPYDAYGKAAGVVAVTAVEDVVHYSDRPAGRMIDETERRVRERSGGGEEAAACDGTCPAGRHCPEHGDLPPFDRDHDSWCWECPAVRALHQIVESRHGRVHCELVAIAREGLGL
jgi:hypothetical protein